MNMRVFLLLLIWTSWS